MFNWFDKLLVKIAKKILNKYAPDQESLYINPHEERALKELGGYGQPINAGVKSFILEWILEKELNMRLYLKQERQRIHIRII